MLAPGPLEGVALRYGFFYGPGTIVGPFVQSFDPASWDIELVK